MTPEQMKELLPVAVAYAEGKVVQVRAGCEAWADYVGQVAFLDPVYEWRVKPEPREWNICPKCNTAFNLFTGPCCGHKALVRVREVLL